MAESEENQPIICTSFGEWCFHKNSLSKEAKHTVEVLLKRAGTSYCYKADIILSNTTSLSFVSARISDLTALVFLTNLTDLNLENNQISDLTPLQSLTNLTKLNLENNQISDLTPLQSLTNLTKLYLNTNQISDLTPLQSLRNLTHLGLSNNQISDLTPLQSLRNLTYLGLGNNQISDLTPLQSLTNLTDIYLNNNQISDLTPLQSLRNLTYLNLDNNQISDLIPLQSLTKLNYLKLEKNQLPDSTPLKSLWKVTLNSTERVDRTRAAAAIKFAYATLGKPCPKIIFCASPHSAIAQLKSLEFLTNKTDLFVCFYQQIKSACRLFYCLKSSVSISGIRWEGQIEQELRRDIADYLNYSTSIFTWNSVMNHLLKTIYIADFCVSVLKIFINPDAQKAFECLKQLLVECGWIFAFDDVCCVCDRPSKLSLDSEDRLHAEGESAIEFADGYKLYSYYGVTLPEKYGQIHPNQWEARWILEEENAEVRRALIQGIGYARICSELQAAELDSWQEYTLLKIDFEDDFDESGQPLPVFLLKMTCPSTGHIHALRVPPDVVSAQEAIRWVNWDIDSEDFLVQT